MKMNLILLIDDDEATNYYHKLVIEEADCTHRVEVVRDGKEALAFLEDLQQKSQPYPDLIFLDINMPVMDGWEFLDNYETPRYATEKKNIIVMLTTSLNPQDVNKAENYSSIIGFENKPLSAKMLVRIISEMTGLN